ncbi:UNVERIFIED_CONTAM: hypothetical protein PYX00_001358 [Menopon gallinae]|uniref:Uncharacterized protein n=1 Tax=Menopon gallinae TaxID=328185 RepID=A0AAW2ID95_9NEOP
MRSLGADYRSCGFCSCWFPSGTSDDQLPNALAAKACMRSSGGLLFLSVSSGPPKTEEPYPSDLLLPFLQKERTGPLRKGEAQRQSPASVSITAIAAIVYCCPCGEGAVCAFPVRTQENCTYNLPYLSTVV